MINMLVIEDNFHFSKALINIIVQEIPQVRLCKIATDGQDALDFLMNNTNNVDIILLDLQLPNLNGIEFINRLEKFNYNKYRNSIIVISGQMDLILQIKNNPYLFSYINKTSRMEKILAEINNLINIKEEEKSSIEYKVFNELETLHYNFSYIGTKYLMETILLLYKTNKWEDIKLEKEIYPILSKKYKKTIRNIKTNIIHATDLMYYDCKSDILNNYFKLFDSQKPTPKTVISTITSKLKYSM